jgi:hypothetical protein
LKEYTLADNENILNSKSSFIDYSSQEIRKRVLIIIYKNLAEIITILQKEILENRGSQ